MTEWVWIPVQNARHVPCFLGIMTIAAVVAARIRCVRSICFAASPAEARKEPPMKVPSPPPRGER